MDPLDSASQTASRSVQPFLHSSWQGVPIGLLNSVRRNAINARFKKLIVAINAIKNLIVWQPQSFTISDSASKSSDRTVNISLQHCMYLLRCLALVDQQCPANGPVLAASCRRWVKRFYQLLSFFLWIFPQRLRIFNQNFTRLLRCVFALNYNTLFNYLTLSKLCHIKRDRPVNFHFCNTSKQRVKQIMTVCETAEFMYKVYIICYKFPPLSEAHAFRRLLKSLTLTHWHRLLKTDAT